MPSKVANSKWHLKRLYTHFNRKWFAGALPNNTVVMFAKCQRGMLATTEYIPVEGVPAVISIAPILRRVGWDVTAMTLLHEMVHLDLLLRLGNGHNHGKRFNERMLKLAKDGAFDRYW